VREESHNVTAVARFHTLPDMPYAMWVRDELAAHLHLPNDGTRLEVIGGEIVVSPGPTFDHNVIVQDIQDVLVAARLADPAFPWRSIQNTDLNLVEVGDGYVPDLIVLDEETFTEARNAQARHLFSSDTALVVEVTSPSNAGNDRMPDRRWRRAATKWSGYAKAGIQRYLLVDRAPNVAVSTLFTDPDRQTGTFRSAETWKFGETVRLPDPLGFEIATDEWAPWAD
jgi:Uma2 family endonuclease